MLLSDYIKHKLHQGESSFQDIGIRIGHDGEAYVDEDSHSRISFTTGLKGIQEEWSIGTYYGDNSVCVNLKFNGKKFHRHDYGVSIIPRFIRVGWYIRQIEKESGIREQTKKAIKDAVNINT